VRGLHPWPHAYTHLDRRRLILLKTQVDPGPSDAEPGTIIALTHDAIHVATGREGRIAITRLQPDGGRAMGAGEFLAGHHVEPGMRLGGP
jgi:methionyl-tRNA formyltransferase